MQGARTRRNCDEAPAGPGSPGRPCGPAGPTCPCGLASPLAPVSPFGPCGPGVGWPHPAIIVAIANARIMTAARIESTPCSLASTAQTLNETSIWRTRSPAMRQVNVCLNGGSIVWAEFSTKLWPVARNIILRRRSAMVEAPRGKRAHAVGAHIGEGHDGGGVRRYRKRFPRRIVERPLPRHGNLNAHGAFLS